MKLRPNASSEAREWTTFSANPEPAPLPAGTLPTVPSRQSVGEKTTSQPHRLKRTSPPATTFPPRLPETVPSLFLSTLPTPDLEVSPNLGPRSRIKGEGGRSPHFRAWVAQPSLRQPSPFRILARRQDLQRLLCAPSLHQDLADWISLFGSRYYHA